MNPFNHRLAQLTDENFVPQLQKLIGAIGSHTLGHEQAMPVFGVLRALAESRR